jgi:hypothetical protein
MPAPGALGGGTLRICRAVAAEQHTPKVPSPDLMSAPCIGARTTCASRDRIGANEGTKVTEQ